MKPTLLSGADLLRLHDILNHLSPPPRPSHEQRLELAAFLETARESTDPSVLEQRVGIGDDVTLVSPSDVTDDFAFRIVMPHEADPAEGRISVLAPVSLAILGREKGGIISWHANGVMREMKITGLLKQSEAGVISLSP